MSPSFSPRGTPAPGSHSSAAIVAILGLLFPILLPLARGADPVPAPAAPAESPVFLTPATVVRIGPGQVIPFKLDHPAPDRVVYAAKVEPPDRAEILQQPTVLKGESLGYLRLRPLRAGSAVLRVGDRSLALQIVPDELPEPRPEIVTPVAGSDVWGKIAVGVELFSDRAATDDRAAALRLPDGTELAPQSRPGPREGSHLRFAFTVDADRLVPGLAFLTAVVKGRDGAVLESRPLPLNVIRPDPARLVAGACAEQLSGPRSQKAGDKPPPLRKDPQAAGGNCVFNEGGNPGWCLPVEVSEPGLYQMMMTVRGDFGGGALPTVGIRLNEEQVVLSSARLADTGWHRIPVGAPFRLPAGSQILTAVFTNDFYFKKEDDRNLYLDRYELLRLDDAAAAATAAPGDAMTGGSMMAASTMMAPAPTAPAASEVAPAMAPSAAMDAQSRNMGRDDIDLAATSVSGPGELLHAAFDRVIDGQPVDGLVTLHARAWWANAGRSLHPQPRVELKVNGVAQDVQHGADLWFRVAPGSLLPGANTVSLRATLPGGIAVEEPGQRIFRDPAPAGSPRRYLRFTVVDPAWGTSLAERVRQPDRNRPDRAAVFASPGTGVLSLPDDLEGDFNVVLEGKVQGPAVPLRLSLRPGSGPLQTLGEMQAAPGQTVAKVHLPRGAKQLLLARLEDPKPVPGDRSYSLQALRLDEAKADGGAPRLAVLYPVDGALLGQADAVVVQPFAAAGIDWVDVAVDGQPLGLRLKPRNGLGRLLFPLVTRNLAAGKHQLKVLAQSGDGKPGESAPVSFEVAARPQPMFGPYARAIHLLNRFAYGPEPDELASILVEGEGVWLRQRLAEPVGSPAMQGADEELRVLYPEEHASAPVRALQQLLLTPNPARARFVMWSENHFSTWVDKIFNEAKWDEHLQFWDLGAAPFGDLLFTSATSPAMLVYLDQFRSFANKLNENYAREIMELHTLGVHGGYTQADVTTLAGVLNGWTLSDEADLDAAPGPNPHRVFRFDPELNDGKARVVIGMEFPAAAPADRFDRILAAIETLAAHPSTAAFVSRKLAEQYVADPAPPALVERLGAIYLATGGDMRALLQAIAESPEFWASVDSPRMATPLDYGIRLSRLSGFGNPGRVADFLKQSGAGLFDRATPDGFPEVDSEYASSNALLQRWRLAREAEPQFNAMMPADWLLPGMAWTPERQQALIDYAALRLTGRLLSPASEDAVRTVLQKTAAAPADKPSLVASFICQLPEANLR